VFRRLSLSLSRKVLALTLAGGIAVTAGLAFAPSAAADSEAPASEANALGLRIDPVIQISGTHAHADDTNASSSADVLKVLGTSPVANTGGSKGGNSATGGALADTGTTPVGRARVAPWSAAASTSPSHRRAEATAALASVVLFNNSTLFIDLLRAQSAADHDSATRRSTGASSSDGAVVGALGAVTVDVLHSDASSDAGGHSWLLGINGMTFGTSDQVSSICSLNIAPLAAMACLDVVGGIGENNGASLLDGSVLNMVRPGALLLSTTTGTGSATPVVFGAHEDAVGRAINGRSGVRGATAGRLPRTGAPTILLATIGLLLVTVGLAGLSAAKVRPTVR